MQEVAATGLATQGRDGCCRAAETAPGLATISRVPQIEDGEFLITGGSGFIGSHVVDRLLERGAKRVRVFDKALRSENLPESDRLEAVEGDVTDLEAVRRALAGAD